MTLKSTRSRLVLTKRSLLQLSSNRKCWKTITYPFTW